MSYAAYKMMHWPTGIEHCASGFITHCRADLHPKIPPINSDDLESDWPTTKGIGPVPNLVITAANILEMASENFVQPSIPRFDGHYDHWSMLMENFLRSKEYCSNQIFKEKEGDVVDLIQVLTAQNQETSLMLSAIVVTGDNLNSDELHHTYAVEEFEVRILEPEKSGGPWQTKATIPIQSSENALTIRMVTLPNFACPLLCCPNSNTNENETLVAIGTAYVQGEDVAARGRVLLFSVGKGTDASQNMVSESRDIMSYSVKWDLPANNSHDIMSCSVKWDSISNILCSITMLSSCRGEFLIDGSTLNLTVSDEQKNIQIFYYAPKVSESWKGQKLLSRAEFHAGAHVTKFLRLQMLPTSSDRSGSTQVADKTNRFALLFGTLDGSIGCIAPLDDHTFQRLRSLQKKLVDAVPHVARLNPRSFRQFRSNRKAHRPGPDSMVDCELLSHFSLNRFLLMYKCQFISATGQHIRVADCGFIDLKLHIEKTSAVALYLPRVLTDCNMKFPERSSNLASWTSKIQHIQVLLPHKYHDKLSVRQLVENDLPLYWFLPYACFNVCWFVNQFLVSKYWDRAMFARQLLVEKISVWGMLLDLRRCVIFENMQLCKLLR
ncbi:Cleavage/polyadenylation specificity factor, A subunit, C-terminal [Dillenia turbinata]|uniref:Cleavage/polyadenylation specificity factor, A subunit, C-terminal n=1 Tax=Dillenia turbinata TaxID=194707 RepID=A0AAN8VY55_9MAGN